jgi:hypothetical protein
MQKETETFRAIGTATLLGFFVAFVLVAAPLMRVEAWPLGTPNEADVFFLDDGDILHHRPSGFLFPPAVGFEKRLLRGEYKAYSGAGFSVHYQSGEDKTLVSVYIYAGSLIYQEWWETEFLTVLNAIQSSKGLDTEVVGRPLTIAFDNEDRQTYGAHFVTSNGANSALYIIGLEHEIVKIRITTDHKPDIDEYLGQVFEDFTSVITRPVDSRPIVAEPIVPISVALKSSTQFLSDPLNGESLLSTIIAYVEQTTTKFCISGEILTWMKVGSSDSDNDSQALLLGAYLAGLTYSDTAIRPGEDNPVMGLSSAVRAYKAFRGAGSIERIDSMEQWSALLDKAELEATVESILSDGNGCD